MNIDFTRPMHDDVLNSILLEEPFRFLTRNINELIKTDPYAFSVQLLSHNKIAYHHGSKCVLTASIALNRSKPIIRFSADQDFRDHRLNPVCSRQCRALTHTWTDTDTSTLRNSFKDYLRAVVSAVDNRYYRGDDQGNRAEGFWINLVCRRYGDEFTNDKAWLIIDRDFSLGFPHAAEKKKFYNEYANPYMAIKMRLQEKDPREWGKPSKRAFKHEVGLLAIDESGQPAVIELRRGTNTSGICWAPMSAAAHRDAINAALPDISQSIHKLISQKIALGLLPMSARQRTENKTFDSVSAIVAIADPQPDDHPSWMLLNESIKEVEAFSPGHPVETTKITR